MLIGSNVIAALKAGKRLSLTFQDIAKNKIVLPIALDNFAEAFQRINESR